MNFILIFRKYFCLLLLLYVFANHISAQTFSFQNGDILFQVNPTNTFTQAIKAATTNENVCPYTHVGMVVIENETVYVIEATSPRVGKIILDTFLANSLFVDGKPIVTVARLKPRYRKYISSAIKNAYLLIGKNYDYVFYPDNDAYYCSELIYSCFLNNKGNPLFKAIPMTFKDSTGQTAKAWIEHFNKYKTAIPEGFPGTNLVEMYTSKIIKSVYFFSNLCGKPKHKGRE